ncbi:hypothetical protein QOZ80_8BG0666450 [Eleusine coracana subsp. coracana]|nr:hypothetical protein QOZ80_8BG0666450 [Eleusine coracana subsp. coracana]
MDSGGHKTASGAVPGAGTEGGHLCHACGYHYPNAHPSAKQRRAHRKHCGKPASAAAEEAGAGEPEGRVLFPGEGGGATEVGGGDGIGPGAAECGGGSPGSAQEAGSAAVDVDKTEHSSHDVAGAQVSVDNFVEDHSDVASGITPETNRIDDGGTVNEVAMECSGKASLPEEGVPSVPASAVSSEELQDVSVPVLSPEPGYGEGVSPELSVSEMQNSNVESVASDAIGGEISGQTNDVLTEPNDTAVTGVDAAADSIDKDIPNEEKSIPASAISSEQLQDVSVPVLPPEPGYDGVSPELPVSEMQNSNVVSVASDATGGEISEQTTDVITEPNGTTITGIDGTANIISKDIQIEEKSVKGDDLDSSYQQTLQTNVGEGHSNAAVEEDSSNKNLSAAQIEEIPSDKSDSNQQSSPMLTSSTEVVSKTEDDEPVKSGIQAPVGTDDFHSEATDNVKPQEQPDSTSVAKDHRTVPEQTNILEGDHYPSKDNMAKNVSSSDATMEDTIWENENVTSNTVVPSQADLLDVSTSSTIHEINMVNSINDVEEKGQKEKSVADLTTHEINEVHITELVEEKQQDKEIVADSISYETNAFCSIDNYGENKIETIVEASSCNIPSTSSIEEVKQIEEVIADPTPETTTVISNKDGVEVNKQIDVGAMTNREISVVCSAETVEEKDTTSEIYAENITDNVEDKKQSEDISASNISDGTSMIYTTVNKEKMLNEGMTEDPNEKIVVHSTDNVEERNYEVTTMDPNSHDMGMVTTTNSVEERKNDETSADPTSHGINAPHSSENVEEKDGEPVLEPISSKFDTARDVGDAEEKQNEETTADQISGENSSMPQSTYDAENDIQNKDAATVLVSDKPEVAKKTDTAEGTEQNKETTAKEISTVQNVDDVKGAGQNEEIADKEVIVDSDRSHVSLKVLLADKNVETKEKKPSTKDRVLSFRRRSSKDNESPAKPGSPKADSGQQDWNSPARLPAEKKSKGKKQQWVPFICCPSIH